MSLKSRVLVRHPAPYSTESLSGYLLRLSEINGYPNAYYMAADCGMPHFNGLAKYGLVFLEQVTNRQSEELKRVATVVNDCGNGMVLGQPIARMQLNLMRCAVCPDCVRQLGFIQAHFSLSIMTACPEHWRPVVNACSNCLQPLKWSRSGLLECKCGGVLRTTEDIFVKAPVVELLESVRRKVLSLPPVEHSTSGLPALALGAMSLRSFLYLVRSLGMRSVRELGETEIAGDEGPVVEKAAEILSNWPHNFRKMLAVLAGSASPTQPCKLTKGALSGVYYSLMYGIAPRKEADFVRDELTRFAVERLGVGTDDRNRLEKIMGETKRLLTRSELAERLGIDRRYANRILQEENISTVRVDGASKRPRLLIDMSKVNTVSRSPGKIHNPKNAAAIIGISRNMLILLRELGMFEVKHLPPGIRGFHEKDCETYKQKLLASSGIGRLEHENSPTVNLGSILRGGNTNALTKARMISEVHSGHIPVVGMNGKSVKGLLLPKDAVESFLETNRNPDWSIFRGRSSNTSNGRGGISMVQAMREIDCSKEAIRGLVLKGLLLKSKGKGSTNWILADSVDKFRAEYVSLRSVAKEARTSEEVLRKACKELQVKLLNVKNGTATATSFVHKQDLTAVYSFRSLGKIVKPAYTSSLAATRSIINLLGNGSICAPEPSNALENRSSSECVIYRGLPVSVTAIRALPRHPAPRPTESLWGYILRVSSANGFRSPWSVFTRAGMEQHETRFRSLRVEKLALVTCQRVADLKKIAYYNPDLHYSCLLLGHAVSPTELGFVRPHVCIQCVQQLGYIEAHWDLERMNGCPIHMCRAVSVCASCGLPLRWYRQGLMRCSCGSRLYKYETKTIEQKEADLLQIIRTKVLYQLPLSMGWSRLPIADLYRLQLSTLLKLIRIIARCSVDSGEQLTAHGEHDTICCTANVLSDWPHGFFRLLSFMRDKRSTGNTDVREQYAPLYGALLKRDGVSDYGELNFLREAFLDFVSNHAGPRPADIRLMKNFEFGVSRRFVTCAEFARIANIDPRTLRNVLQDRTTNEDEGLNPSDSTSVIDSHCLPLKTRVPGEVLNSRRAAARLGIPVETLRSLKFSGHFEVQSLPINMAGFHQGDLEEFHSRLVARAQKSDSGERSPLLFRDVMKMKSSSAEIKASLIRAILDGEVQVFLREEKSLDLLELDRIGTMKFLKQQRLKYKGNYCTGVEAAERIRCSFDVIVHLVALGLLIGEKEKSNWRISSESVERFRSEYWSISVLAASQKTSSRRIQDICSKNGIALLAVPLHNARSKLYASIADRPRISRLLEAPAQGKRGLKCSADEV